MVPVSIFITDFGNDILEGLISSFHLSISLRVIGCGLDVLNLILFVEDFIELVDKFCSSVCSNLLRGLESADNFSVQEISN